MFRYFLKRLSINIITFMVLIVFAYILIASFSKNPFAGGPDPDTAQELFDKNGLGEPVLIRMFNYIGGLFRGDVGRFYVPSGGETTHIPTFFFSNLKWSILIILPALIISSIIGIFLGILAGYKRGTWVDASINVFVIFFAGLPSFVLAPLMILIAQNIPGSIVEFISPDISGSWWITLKSLFLPTTTIVLASLTGFAILSRNQIVSILSSNHILIAKAKGLNNIEIFKKHIIRNISIPILSVVLPSFVLLLAGNVIIEQFFRVPGVSNVIIQSFPNGEVNITMFSILIFSSLSLSIQLILDILYVITDPRIKYVSSNQMDIFSKINFLIKRRKNEKNIDLKKEKEVKNG